MVLHSRVAAPRPATTATCVCLSVMYRLRHRFFLVRIWLVRIVLIRIAPKVQYGSHLDVGATRV